MKYGIIYYKNTYNIGDDIQTFAALKLLENNGIKQEEIIFIDRETLHEYNGEKVHLLFNGWFMSDPKNWPPSNLISPFFISIHLSPETQKHFKQKNHLKIFKDNEPIGCRDYNTYKYFIENGIEAYVSSCLTLTLNKVDVNLNEANLLHKQICFVDAFHRMPKFQNQLIKGLISSYDDVKIKYFTHIDSDIKYRKLNNRLNDVVILLQKYCESEFVFTSRIHAALPVAGIGGKVCFLNFGMEHDSDSSRLGGLSEYFTIINANHVFELNNINILKKIKNRISKKFTFKHIQFEDKSLEIQKAEKEIITRTKNWIKSTSIS